MGSKIPNNVPFGKHADKNKTEEADSSFEKRCLTAIPSALNRSLHGP